eukprot:CAMPEP_0182887156 /NCGR_PEP_ID=MMETSP0034_2-20130328/20649_1 /TAXON_ID=156128 /ORGANISM="Nephroselmis pyriformis, Strain CCMP717" /LENGTH=872 /DNA_ID=CAMNT_0025020509 /DNA_START=157 /DNA_END=2772 /DNA_ORIENTATION=-
MAEPNAVTQVLQNAQSADANLRNQAEQSLKTFEGENYAGFLVAMSTELADNSKPVETRRLAGIILKNALHANDEARKAEMQHKWVSADPNAKAGIKGQLLATLQATVSDARHGAAQAIAKVAAIELPFKAWPELINALLANMSSPDSGTKQATLESFGYICEEIGAMQEDVLEQEQVNNVLTAVVQGIRKEEPDNNVRLAATNALLNALEFSATNFENEYERNYIMTVTCEATFCTDPRVRLSAFECLVGICATYYDKMAPYIQEIFNITLKCTKEDEESIALQAIELWSTICDEEIALQDDIDEGDSDVVHHHFIKQALPGLVPMLLETLFKQEEDQDSDDSAWNLAMAGGTCLGLVANCVCDDVVPLVIPFVQENIAAKTTPEDWRRREGAMFAFGSILEGPSPEKLAPLLSDQALQYILTAMMDENAHVKDTTAWTIGRICELLHSCINANNLPTIVGVLVESLKAEPHVAAKVCGAIYNLASGFEDLEGPSPLTPYFTNIIQKILEAASRPDADQGALRMNAYEALSEMVRCSSLETQDIIVQLIPVVMTKLQETFQMPVLSAEDKEKQGEVQGLLCGTLQVIVQKLGAPEALAKLAPFCDPMMELFLSVFACNSGEVHEECMLAIGAVAQATGEGFLRYMDRLKDYLDMGLKNHASYAVCAVTVGVVGDVCRALEQKLLPYCDQIVLQLLQSLQSNELHRSVKPPILCAFGDIALAIGVHFEKYLNYVVPMLQQAAQLSVSTAAGADEEMIEYNNELRSGIFEAFSGIFQGFKSQKIEPLQPHADSVLQFIEAVYADRERDENVTKLALGLLGDVADTLRTAVGVGQLFVNRPFWKPFTEESMGIDDETIRFTAKWAKEEIEGRIQA